MATKNTTTTLNDNNTLEATMNTESANSAVVSTTAIELNDNTTLEATMNTESANSAVVSTSAIDVNDGTLGDAMDAETLFNFETPEFDDTDNDDDIDDDDDTDDDDMDDDTDDSKFKVHNNFDDLFEFEEDFDLFNYDVESPKPSDKARKQSHLHKILADGDVLAQEYKDYEKDYVTRGNKMLYSLLTKIYKYALDIDFSNSTLREDVLDGMRKHLKECYGVKTTMKTPWLTTVIKYIVKANRQTASNYSRVLRVAHSNDIAVKDLTAYIEDRGGIGCIKASDDEVAKRKEQKEIKQKRLDIMRESFEILAKRSKNKFTYEGDTVQFPRLPLSKSPDHLVKESNKETSSFAIFITTYDSFEDAYYILQACDFGKTFEDVILNHISQRVPASTQKIEDFVKNHYAKMQATQAQQNASAMNDSDYDDEPVEVEATFTDGMVGSHGETLGELVVVNASNDEAANSQMLNAVESA
ncbi:MAG: hypothetical protein NTZ45_01350 [Methylococcales bacterium]|nr:hypothetical protein [Methylococcales bacterium]